MLNEDNSEKVMMQQAYFGFVRQHAVHTSLQVLCNQILQKRDVVGTVYNLAGSIHT